MLSRLIRLSVFYHPCVCDKPTFTSGKFFKGWNKTSDSQRDSEATPSITVLTNWSYGGYGMWKRYTRSMYSTVVSAEQSVTISSCVQVPRRYRILSTQNVGLTTLTSRYPSDWCSYLIFCQWLSPTSTPWTSIFRLGTIVFELCGAFWLIEDVQSIVGDLLLGKSLFRGMLYRIRTSSVRIFVHDGSYLSKVCVVNHRQDLQCW